jgi:RHS repeat-associated protein
VDDGSTWAYPVQDALGSVRGYVDENNAVLSHVNYNEYGVPDAAITSFAFTGEWRDENVLQYHRARYYAPGIGVWASLDPFEGMTDRPMSLNGYSWVEGNPVMNTDSTGMYFWTGRGEGLELIHNAGIVHQSNVSIRIQALAMVGGMASVHAEYPIPLGNVANVPEIFSSNVSFAYIDLLHEVLGEIWEIKPYYQEAEAAAIALAQVQMMNNLKGLDLLHGMYPTGMPYNWNISPATWRLGSSFPMTPVSLGTDPGGGPNMFGCGLWMAMLTLISACGIIGVSPQHEGEPPGAGVYGAPMWSPDGAYLVFSHRTDYHADLWLYEIETKEYKNLNIDGDVSLIFGGSWQNSETLWFFLGGGASNLYKLNIRSDELEYVRTVISWLGFSIRPDTEELVFSSRSGTQVDLYLSDLRFETIIRLTDSTDLMESYPLWSPDGRYLAYQTEDGIGIRDEHGNTWTIDAAVKEVHIASPGLRKTGQLCS